MTKIEHTPLERALSAAFRGGEVTARELRLSEEEAEYLRAAWPRASVTALNAPSGDKAWYEVRVAQ